MKLSEFLRRHTQPKELCVICLDGWIISTAWIDHEDLFLVHPKIRDKEVKRHDWDYLPTVNKNGTEVKIPCHYIYI